MAPPRDLARHWSELHHGIDPATVPLLGPWLRAMWWSARPLAAARVPPTAITVAGVVLTVLAVLPARDRPWAAGVLVLVGVLCDSLDGAVAVVGGRASRSGAVADAVADRIGDVALAAVVWRCGAPAWLAAAAGVLALAVDATRRLRRVPAAITVAERPSLTICALLACASATVSSATWPPTVCAAVWVALSLLALAQLARARRHVTHTGPDRAVRAGE